MVKALVFVLCACGAFAADGLRVPAFTAYLEPNPNSAHISKTKGISHWRSGTQHILWFGEFKSVGALNAAVSVQPSDSRLQLKVGDQKHEATVQNGIANFGTYAIANAGYVRFELSSLNGNNEADNIEALVLNGPATKDAHFNLKERRNAASVHLMYSRSKDQNITKFYNEVTAVEDPVATFYMACGFSRGYLGMQVNSDTERRIIFSIWDAGNGQGAKDRTNVAADDQTQLIAKGDGVEASVFGNEGTGGHSHLVYPWKTGGAQKFLVQVKVEGTHTLYSGYWFHPERRQWMLIASFRAAEDGKYLHSLYSFSENFDGSNGHLQRKALYGPQWIQTDAGKWVELTEAKFSHDPIGKADRLDRFMGVESGKFFLSQGGFVEGSTKYGDAFSRPASASPPAMVLPAP